jgi:hypothetical protein
MPTDTTATEPPVPIPRLVWMARVEVDVASLVSLGGPAKHGERRYVSLLGGRVLGPELTGVVLPGGTDWQVQRADGATDISAHYVIRAQDGALIEVQSDGLRHGPPETMAALARGEAVDPAAYYFRTLVRLTTGAPQWLHLNKMLVLASGKREAAKVILGLWRVG